MKRLIALTAALFLICSCAAAEQVTSNGVTGSGIEIIEPVVRTVQIEWENGKPASVMKDTPLRIISTLTGFEDAEEIVYMWEINRHDGAGFVEISGENKSYLIVYASAETLSCDYRLTVFWR